MKNGLHSKHYSVQDTAEVSVTRQVADDIRAFLTLPLHPSSTWCLAANRILIGFRLEQPTCSGLQRPADHKRSTP